MLELTIKKLSPKMYKHNSGVQRRKEGRWRTFITMTSINKHRIIASIDPINIASIKLIERLGFRKEAHFIESLFFHGQWVDDLIYALLEKEWIEKTPKQLTRILS